jgi:hypothetical protein
MFGAAPVLINMGVNGLVATAYILLIGGDLNGATLGRHLTVIGFSAYGKHAANILPVMCGVSSAAPSSTTMSTLLPFSSPPLRHHPGPHRRVFGWPYGVLAGFLHSAVVLRPVWSTWG